MEQNNYKDPVTLLLAGTFLLSFGLWHIKNDIAKFHTFQEFKVFLFLLYITIPLGALISGLILILLAFL
ncbi:MAG: hypothetical protein A4E53_01942 [Pelotomaculum sp. PtaB.Bin104]|nr:MAG: hypothetical protein A4E53_01942 [Pelotomaculum sp. PtaB.Bin104]